MTEPGSPDPSPEPSLAEVAQEPPEESTAREQEVVGGGADTGDVVESESAQ